MTWVVVLALATAAFLLPLWLLRVPKGGREAIAAALALGVAGYALQGEPSLPGSPREYREASMGDPAAFVELRYAILQQSGPPTSRWLVIADAMVRRGRFADAAEILRGAVADDPKDAEAWLAMGNALVGHADGFLTPAALTAFRNAAGAEPNSPAAPFFLGLALAQSGQLGQARAMWAELLAQAPADAPWREEVQVRLDRLDAFIAARVPGPDGR